MKHRTNSIIAYITFVAMTLAQAMYASDSVQARDQMRISTALDHLTVFEFDETVAEVAIGSTAFQVERQENKVFVKPLKAGATTNLFVWTASKRNFEYELSVGEVSSMTAEIHTATRRTTQKADATEMERLADQLISSTLVGREAVDNHEITSAQNRINLRVEGLFRGQKTTYIQYSVENLTSRPYRLVAPVVYQLQPQRTRVSLIPLRNTQLNRNITKQLGKYTELPLPIAHSDSQIQDVAPGEKQQGIVAIRSVLVNGSPALCRLVLDPRTDATVVF